MSIIQEYLKIIGELGKQQELSPKDLITDLLTLDTIASQFLQSGILDVKDEYGWREFHSILTNAVQSDLIKVFVETLHKVSDQATNINLLKDCALISEHITEVDIDLSHYPSVSDAEMHKLITVIESKYPNRFIVMTINLPNDNSTIEFLSTYKQRTTHKKHLSDLDTLLSLYMEVNSGE